MGLSKSNLSSKSISDMVCCALCFSPQFYDNFISFVPRCPWKTSTRAPWVWRLRPGHFPAPQPWAQQCLVSTVRPSTFQDRKKFYFVLHGSRSFIVSLLFFMFISPTLCFALDRYAAFYLIFTICKDERRHFNLYCKFLFKFHDSTPYHKISSHCSIQIDCQKVSKSA